MLALETSAMSTRCTALKQVVTSRLEVRGSVSTNPTTVTPATWGGRMSGGGVYPHPLCKMAPQCRQTRASDATGPAQYGHFVERLASAIPRGT